DDDFHLCENPGTNDPEHGPRYDFQRMGWTYLNGIFNKDIIGTPVEPEPGTWRADGCFDNIEQYLDYRFVLNSAEIPTEIKPGGRCSVKLNVKNKCWTGMYN